MLWAHTDADAAIEIWLDGTRIGKATADRDGAAPTRIVIEVPADASEGPRKLEVVAGETRLGHAIEIRSHPDLLLTSDRRLYPPGDEVQLRALVVEAATRRILPGQTVIFEVRDPRDRALLREPVVSNEWGVAATRMPITEGGLVGLYRATARVADTIVTRDLRVQTYERPVFEVELTTGSGPKASGFARLGERLVVKLEARHRHGAPLAGASVEIVATVLAAQQGRRFARAELVLDEEGRGRCKLPPPVLPTSGQAAWLALEIGVTDSAGHHEVVVRTLPLARSPLVIAPYWLHPPLANTDNRLAVRTTRPNGQPVAAQLILEQDGTERARAETDARGLALMEIGLDDDPRSDLELVARTETLSSRQPLATFTPHKNAIAVLVNQPVVRSGHALMVELRTPRPRASVEVELRNGRSVLDRATVSVNHTGQTVALRVPDGVTGMAYVVARAADGVATRRVLVMGARIDAQVEAHPQTVAPGEAVDVTVALRDEQGRPTAGAVELAILDAALSDSRLDGAGLLGAEPWFGIGQIPGRVRLGPLTAAGGPHTLVELGPSRWQDRSLELDFPEPGGAGPASTWQGSLSAMLSALPLPSPLLFDRLVWITGPALAALLLLLGLWRRRPLDDPFHAPSRRRRSITTLALGVHIVALATVPFWTWSHGPRLNPLGNCDADPAHPNWDLEGQCQPRRFPGMSPGAFHRDLTVDAQEHVPPDAGTVIHVGQRLITVNGEPIVNLDDFRVPASMLRGDFLIKPLFDRLDENMRSLRRVGERADHREIPPINQPDRPASEPSTQTAVERRSGLKPAERGQARQTTPVGAISLLMSPATPYGLITQILYTAGQAEHLRWSMAHTGETRIERPTGLGPDAHPLAWALVGLLLTLALIVERATLGAWLLLAAVSLSAGAAAALRPMATGRLAHVDFPIIEALSWLHIAIAGVVALGLMGRALRAGRGSTIGLAALAWVSVALAVTAIRDLRPYFVIPHSRVIVVPTLGMGAGTAEPSTGARASSAPPESAPSAPTGTMPTRSYFPETLLYDPWLVVDGSGQGRQRVTMGHQLTRWAVTALGHVKRGAMAIGRADLITQKPLEIAVELPERLTVGDVVHLPVRVYNHGERDLSADVSLIQADWLELKGKDRSPQMQSALHLPAGRGSVVARPFQALLPGDHTLRIEARAGEITDAIEHHVRVAPQSSVLVDESISVQTRAQNGGQGELMLRPEALTDSAQLTLTLFPDVTAQLAEGAVGLLQAPHGCAEQTISSTLPNLLLLDLIDRRQIDRPALAATARRHSLAGYQRLLGYQQSDGGFSLWNRGPALHWLSAYALELLARIAQRFDIGEAPLARTAQFVVDALDQSSDRHDLVWAGQVRSAARAAGLGRTQPAIARLGARVRPHAEALAREALQIGSPYMMALAAGALLDLDHESKSTASGETNATALINRLVARLIRAGRKNRQRLRSWPASRTVTSTHSRASTVETTARVTSVLLRAGSHEARTVGLSGLAWLVSQRQGDGRWYTSQDSVRALEALLEMGGLGPKEAASLPEVLINDHRLVPARLDAVERLPSGALRWAVSPTWLRPGRNRVTLRGPPSGGESVALAHLTYRVPWAAVPLEQSGGLHLAITYDQNNAVVGQIVRATLQVAYSGPATGMFLLRYTVPPGFSVSRNDLQDLVDRGKARHFERDGADVIFYLDTDGPRGQLVSHRRHTLVLPLIARAPVEAHAPGALVYDYYAPEVRHVVGPTSVTIRPRPPRSTRPGDSNPPPRVAWLDEAPFRRPEPARPTAGPTPAIPTLDRSRPFRRWYEVTFPRRGRAQRVRASKTLRALVRSSSGIAALTAPDAGLTPADPTAVRGRLKIGPATLTSGPATLNRVEVDRMVGDQQQALVGCYRQALVQTPALTGTVRALIVVGPTGGVASLQLDAARPKPDGKPRSALRLEDHPTLRRCLSRAIEVWRLPRPQPQGAHATIAIPLRFEP